MMITANGVELCAESFGDPSDPPVLLIMGTGASMLWWDEDFCGRLAVGGRFVIRYDHRDTGRSVTYAPGRPEYSGADLVADAAGVLDAYGIAAAHVVGVSAGGAFAQLLALDFPERVLSLVLISTSAAVPVGRALPPPTAELKPEASEIEYACLLAGGRRPFDEAASRDLARREAERARDRAAAKNHDLVPEGRRGRASLAAISAPTVVIHGTADPMFPIEHGEALAAEITGARLVRLADAGHGVDRADWDVIVEAILSCG
jgi:pimeloyl-ACP methyl ester carboxylesterase